MPTFKPRTAPPKTVRAVRFSETPLEKIIEFVGPDLIGVSLHTKNQTLTFTFGSGPLYTISHGDYMVMDGDKLTCHTPERFAERYHLACYAGDVALPTIRHYVLRSPEPEDLSLRVEAECFDGVHLDAIRARCGNELTSLNYTSRAAGWVLLLGFRGCVPHDLLPGQYLVRHASGELVVMTAAAFNAAYIQA